MRAASFLLAGSWLLGCEPAPEFPPIRYETEHLRVGTDFADPVCRGTLTSLDRHVSLLEQLLDFELGQPIELYLYLDVPPCGDPISEGCYYVKQKVIATQYWAARHEIAHAVQHRWGLPVPLFSEGFAEAFSGYRSSFENRYDDLVSLPSRCLGIRDPAGSVDELGGHFLRWLYDLYGAEPLEQLMRLSDGTDTANARAAFRTAYGMDIDNAEQRYYVEAPDYYPGWSRCFSELELVPWEGDTWQPVVELDCAGDQTRGVRQMQRTLGFDLGAAGRYSFEVEAPATAFISTCQTELVPLGMSPPRAPFPVEREAIGSEKVSEDGSEDAAFYQLEPGEPHLLDLAAGRYRVTVSVPGTETATVRLALLRQLDAMVTAPLE